MLAKKKGRWERKKNRKLNNGKKERKDKVGRRDVMKEMENWI